MATSPLISTERRAELRGQLMFDGPAGLDGPNVTLHFKPAATPEEQRRQEFTELLEEVASILDRMAKLVRKEANREISG
jgi:hypothetical protein